MGALIPFGLVPTRALDATPVEVDADGDLLPDDVEQVLITDPSEFDSDDDGIDDYLAAVTRVFTNPFTDGEPIDPTSGSTPPPVTTLGIDHEARVVLTEREDEDGNRAVWMHLLFRFAGGTVPQIPVLQPWMSYAGTNLPLDGVFGPTGLTFGTRDAGAEGLLLRVSARLGLSSDFLLLAPVTIGATVVMDSRVVTTGAILFNATGRAATYTPVSPISGIVLGLSGDDDPFWTDSRVCQLRLSVVGSTSSGHICNIDSARCRSAGQLRCPPNCLTSQGQSLFIPDGLATVTGG